jgi:NTE family protein
MIPFNDNFPKKGWYFSMVSYLLSSDYTNEFQPFNIAKGDFVVATVFKRATIKFQSCGFAFGNES